VGLGLYRAITEFLKKRRIDLVVAHGTLGSPHFIFDEFDVPVITYIEFPSYADHGWDSRYPPTEAQRLIDKNMQMLSYYEVIKSERTLVPTQYAREMFPPFLQDRIVAQFEGMDPEKIAQREPCGIELPLDKQTLCFASRDLSSAKGLDTFIATAAELKKRGEDLHFVVIGDATATTYSFEQIFLERKYGKDKGVTFIEHLMRRYKIDQDSFTLTGKLPYAQYSDLLHKVDLFMYPVKYGSGNWGLVELLMRGRPVVAARRCYVPELIEDGVSGVLVDGDDPTDWAKEILSLLADEQRREALGEAALTASKTLRLDEAAKSYLTLFEEVITQYRAR
jgi:glycosyltransferase involved in cell wall biosynthesis